MSAHGDVFGVSHIDVPVADLERSAQFFAAAFGFSRRQVGIGWLDLDASSLAIRLVETAGGMRHATLRVQVADPANVLRGVIEAGGTRMHDAMRTPDHELVATARDLDGNALVLWRVLTEDEYDHAPELPTVREWSPEAVTLLKSLLLAVPAIFRSLARRKVVRVVEELEAGGRIREIDVVRGYILASAKVTRGRLRTPLVRHGFDPEQFRAEFEAE